MTTALGIDPGKCPICGRQITTGMGGWGYGAKRTACSLSCSEELKNRWVTEVSRQITESTTPNAIALREAAARAGRTLGQVIRWSSVIGGEAAWRRFVRSGELSALNARNIAREIGCKIEDICK